MWNIALNLYEVQKQHVKYNKTTTINTTNPEGLRHNKLNLEMNDVE